MYINKKCNLNNYDVHIRYIIYIYILLCEVIQSAITDGVYSALENIILQVVPF